ncbi:MAG: hypothetical protein HY914_05710 [Desulfomonile tiedjei]|nr:hypothetical protein [Desulfomonile tiedjei]
MTERRTINTGEILKDIQSGMGDIPIMEKYQISPTELMTILKKLQEAKALKHAEVEERQKFLQAHVSQKRVLPRGYTLFSVHVHDATNLSIKGIVNDINEKGLQVAGITTRVGEVRTFLIRSDVFTIQPPIVLEATCRWIKRRDAFGEYVAGWEIIKISKSDMGGLRDLVQRLTISTGM